MAFEAFLEGGDQRPRRRRRLTYVVSLAVHAALLAGGIAYSFWHVEEITPPTVHVTFMAAAPPPAPAPPPPAGSATDATRPKPTHVRVKPTLTAIVQPRPDPPKDEPKNEPDDDDDPARAFAGGMKGGAPGGKIDGVIGGKTDGLPGGTSNNAGTDTPPQPTGPKMVAPQIGASQKESGEDPDFPALYARSGLVYVVLAQVCVSRSGSVDSVTILRGANSTLDDNVVKATRRWHYRPMLANNKPVPFCYHGRFEFKSN